MLGPFLRATREQLGLTQTALADTLGVSQGTVSAVECGRVGLGLDDFADWSAALHLTDEQRLEALRLAGLPRESVQPGAA